MRCVVSFGSRSREYLDEDVLERGREGQVNAE